MDSIEDLQCLTELTEFSAADNQLSSMKDLSKVLGQWTRLVRLEMTGNPLCQNYKYRDRTITMGRCIGKKKRKTKTEIKYGCTIDAAVFYLTYRFFGWS